VEFSWDDTTELYERALAYARKNLPSQAGAQKAGFSRERWRASAEFGFTGLCAPPEHGGMGLGALATARVVEALGRGCPDMGFVFSICAHLFAAVMPIAEHGSAELKEKWLSRMCLGECVGANAISEAEAGSDVFALKTSAVRRGDAYVLSGSKNFVTNGPVADVIVAYASTSLDHGYLGITAFAIDASTPGLVRGEPFAKTGLHGSPIGSVYFEDCRVPITNRLGQEGEGALVFRQSMAWERACLFAAFVGSMDRQIDRAVIYAKERRQFGKPIGKNQAVSHRIADMKVRLEAARLLLYRACSMKDRGEDAALAISMAKLAISEAAVQSGIDSIRIHGGAGVMAETGVGQDLADAIPSTIFSGTSDIQRELIARGLGL
jgi:alkylation response protein AidB-like acyl-CoA dehydrogenase